MPSATTRSASRIPPAARAVRCARGSAPTRSSRSSHVPRCHDMTLTADPPVTTAAPRLMKGNEAMADAAIEAGCDAYFGYPITPQAELLERMARRMPELGRAFVQAESELGAINMGLGAAA